MRIVTLMFVLTGLLVASTGCVSKGRYQSEVDSLQGQLVQTQSALAAQEEKSRALEAQVMGGARKSTVPVESYQGSTYRTPSGFEVPAIDIQKALKGAGYYSGGIDGKIGPDSREALRNFQRDNGLTADGVCGKQTWTKLKVHMA